MKAQILVLFLFLLPTGLLAFDHQYGNYAAVLKDHLVVQKTHTSVRYHALRKHPTKLDAFIQEIEGVSAEDFAQWTPNQQLAFLLNAYNGLVLKLISERSLEIDSINQIGGIFVSAFYIDFFNLLGQYHDLDDLETKAIGENFKEARVHFALVCGARSCPPLRAEPYLAPRLNDQLEDQAMIFLNNPKENLLSSAYPAHLYLSEIIKLHKEDFKAQYGSLRQMLAHFMGQGNPEDIAVILNKQTHLTYHNYIWDLNRYGNE